MIAKRLPTIFATTLCWGALWPAFAGAAEGARPQEEVSSPQRVVAVATERIAREKQSVRVLSGTQSVELPGFSELVVAKATASEADLEKLVGRRVAIVRSAKQRELWEVYTNVVWMVELGLPENVFRVKKVLSCSPQTPIEVHMNGKTRRLKPGQVLLVLG